MIRVIELQRFAYTPHGTFGEIRHDRFHCYTVERPWKQNKRNVSCIPTGLYVMRLGRFRDQYPSYELEDVPKRSLIKIHIANTMDDLRGCIGLGKELGFIRDLWAVSGSRETYNRFMTLMNDDPQAAIWVHNAKELAAV